jgi:hypothetical protein
MIVTFDPTLRPCYNAPIFIDKRRITGRYGTVTEEPMLHVEEALKVATGLAKV